MEQRRVLFYARTAQGGSAFSLYHLATGLDDSRYQPVVLFRSGESTYIRDRLVRSGISTISLRRDKGPSSGTAGLLKPRDVSGHLMRRFGERSAQFYLALKGFYQFALNQAPLIWSIARVIREHKIDLVHLNNGLRNNKAAIIAAWLTQRPCVCHVRMFHQLNPFDKLFARFVDVFVYISTAVAQEHFSQGISASKGIVVHNAIDPQEFELIHDPLEVRREFGWGDRERLIGVIGRLDHWKGHEYFVQAMAEALVHRPHLRGLIVGKSIDTPQNQAYYQHLRGMVKSLGLENKVIFTGFREDVPRVLSALDIVVLSSSDPEPFGRVVIEGMAAGKPVIATAAGGVLDIIEDGITGLLVPRQNASAMAKAILALISQPQRAQQMGQAARRRVEEKFTVQRQVSAIQEIYSDLLKPKTSKASRNRGARQAERDNLDTSPAKLEQKSREPV